MIPDACIKFENYPIKMVGEYAFTVIIYYTIISKFQKFAKNSKIVPSSKKSTSHVTDIIVYACIKFESYPNKTVGGDRL